MEGVTSCKAVSFRQSIIVSGDMRRLKNDSLMSTIFLPTFFFSFQAVFWRDAPATTDTTATTTTTEDIEETRESRKKQHHHHHRKQQKKQHRSQENTRPTTEPGHTGTLPRSSVRRSTSCRRETEPPMRPMTTHNIMSMSMIGKLLKSFSNFYYGFAQICVYCKVCRFYEAEPDKSPALHICTQMRFFCRHFSKQQLLCSYTWTSLYMDGTAVNFFQLIFPHEAGTWDPNYTLEVDFLDHDFL